MSRNRMLIIGGVILAALLIIGGVMLLQRKPASSSAGSANTGAAASSGAGSPSGTSGTRAGASGSAGSGGSATGAGSTNSGSGSAAGSGPSGGSAGGSTTTATTIKPFPPVPDSKIPAQKLTSPAAAGAALAPLSGAPGTTISALKVGSMPDGTTYAMTVRPYGFGPSSVFGSRLVVKVDKVVPGAGAPAESRFNNANMLVLLNTRDGGAITKGGAYSVTIAFYSDGQKMVPVLSKAKPAN